MTSADARANLQDCISAFGRAVLERSGRIAQAQDAVWAAVNLLVEIEKSEQAARSHILVDEALSLLRKARGHA